MLNPKSRSDISDTVSGTRRKALSSENPVGMRILDALAGRDLKWLSRETGIPDSTLSGYLAAGIANADKAVAIGRALERSVEWLMTGAEFQGLSAASVGASLVSVDVAEWVNVPELDLRYITSTSLGEASVIVPMRKDWLHATFRVSSGLWLTKLLADYQPAGLSEDSMVVCRTIIRSDLSENHVCLWRYNGTVVVGRYSVQPDALLARRFSRDGTPLGSAAAMVSTSDRHDLVVSPSQIGDDDAHYHLIGRVLGQFMRPLS